VLDLHTRIYPLTYEPRVYHFHYYIMRMRLQLQSSFMSFHTIQSTILTQLMLSGHYIIQYYATDKSKAKLPRYTPWWRLGGVYSSYSFLTLALDGGEWSASRPGRALPRGMDPPVPIVQEAGWASEPVWTQRLEEKSFAPAGDRTPIARSSSQTLYCLSYPGSHYVSDNKRIFMVFAIH
jgi:hypothetical protein